MCNIKKIKTDEFSIKKPNMLIFFENRFTFDTFKLFLPKNDFVFFTYHLVEVVQHQKNKNWWMRHKCPYLINMQDEKYQQKSQSISSAEPNYLVHFAVRYPICDNDSLLFLEIFENTDHSATCAKRGLGGFWCRGT